VVSVTTARTAAVALAVCLVAAGSAHADAFLRVIAQTAPVHTGPGPGYRKVYIAERGQVFEVHKRGTKDYWFLIELEDGTTGWIYGELVFPFEIVDQEPPGALRRAWRATRDALFGPPPAPRANVEISFSAGALDAEGVFLLRPAWLVDPRFALEAFLGLSPRAQEDVLLGGLGWTLRLWPSATFGPNLHAGFGTAHFRPKADNFTGEERTLMALAVGGGLEMAFKQQIVVRLDYRGWTIFDPDAATHAQELSGGLAIFF
jgi:hypothetical protein